MPPPLQPDPGRTDAGGGAIGGVERIPSVTAATDIDAGHQSSQVSDRTGDGTRAKEQPEHSDQADSGLRKGSSLEGEEDAQRPLTRDQQEKEGAAVVDLAEEGEHEQQHSGAQARDDEEGTREEEHCEQGREAASEISTEEVWVALATAVKAHPKGTHLNEWKDTMRMLFTSEHAKLDIQTYLITTAKQRYPRLTDLEVVHLLEFLSVALEKESIQYQDWQRYVAIMSKKLYIEPRMLSDILVQMTSQLRWTPAPMLKQWSQVVKGSDTQPQKPVAGFNRVEFKPFMFDPSVYAAEDIKRLEAVCQQAHIHRDQGKFRQGTQDEWTVIQGMVEGTIACRELPHFVKQILDEDEQLRLYGTVLAQVEGELTLHLREREELPATQQSTKSIVEAILRAAEPGATQALYNFVNALKTVSYNRVRKELHFYFFTRETAAAMAQVPIPFRGKVYQLRNVHTKTNGSAWERQRGTNGLHGNRPQTYQIRLHNITRFVEIGMLKAYLRKNIPIGFTMETLDQNHPKSHLSTVWQINFRLTGCPTFFENIIRIHWFGHNLVLQHPRAQLRRICLNCGGQGHRMAECNEAEEQKTITRCRTVNEADLTGLEDLAKPFASMADIRKVAEARLTKQQSPVQVGEQRGEASAIGGGSIAPKEATQWTRVPNTAGTRIKIPPKSTAKRSITVLRRQTRSVRASDTDAAGLTTTPQDGKSTTPSQSIKEEGRPPIGLENDRKVKATPSDAILLATLKRERDALDALRKEVTTDPSAQLDFQRRPQEEATPKTWEEVERILGLRRVATAPNGNCQATALVQALVDDDLRDQPQHLEKMIAVLKRGMRSMALTNLDKQFPHWLRKHALLQVGRGWATMSSKNSLSQFQKYLEDYESSPSDANAVIPRDTWGGSDMLVIAANLLQREIFSIGRETHGQAGWHCVKYASGPRTKNKVTFMQGLEYRLGVQECMQMIAASKERARKGSGQMPLVLRYSGKADNEHYSAWVHNGVPLQPPASANEANVMDVDMETTEGRQEEAFSSDEADDQRANLVAVGQRRSPDAAIQRQLAAEFDSDEEYFPPDGSNEDERAITVYHNKQKPMAKRDHVTTPNSKVRIRGTVINTHNAAVPYKRGKPATGEATSRIEVEAENKVRWMDEWVKWKELWPAAAGKFPEVSDSQEQWLQTAAHAPDALLHVLRQFQHRYEILQRLDRSTLIEWMESRRRECILDGLKKIAAITKTRGTREWLLDWEQRWRAARGDEVAEVVNNPADWEKVKSLRYGGDELLKRCVPTNRNKMAMHIVCAELYREEIGALNGGRPSKADTTPQRVREHLHALENNAAYTAAFHSSGNEVNWSELDGYLARALVPADAAGSQTSLL